MNTQITPLAATILLLCAAPGWTQLDYNDGQSHTLSDPLDGSVRVDYNAPGMYTEFTLADGGSISQFLEAYKNARIVLSGGSITQDLAAYDNSQIVIHDGTIGWSLAAYDNAQIILYGSDFRLDEAPVFGEIISDPGNPWTYRHLAGTFKNGRGFNVEFLLSDNARIVLVPEPATIALLALGGLIAAKPRQR